MVPAVRRYSPKCLKRIRHLAHGKYSYIVPGIVGPDEVRTALVAAPLCACAVLTHARVAAGANDLQLPTAAAASATAVGCLFVCAPLGSVQWEQRWASVRTCAL